MKAFAGDDVFVGAGFVLTLTTTKNPASLLPIGPSDDAGEYRIDGGRLAEMVRDATATDLQGIGAPLGELWVRVLNLADIAKLRTGYEMWQSSHAFPERYEGSIDAFENALRPRAGLMLRPTAGAKGGSMNVSCSAQRA